MVALDCNKLLEKLFAKSINAKNLYEAFVPINIDVNSDNVQKLVEEKCRPFLASLYSAQVEKFIEQARYQNYTINFNDINIHLAKYNKITPSLFELAASQIAHYLFPQNFVQYKFIINPNKEISSSVLAAYFMSEVEGNEVQCDAEIFEGVENVYATAFYLGLEIRSYQCVRSSDKTYILIGDFSYPFHEIDIEQKVLVEEYRDHKILSSDKGTLFPTSFANTDCGAWLGKGCDVEKLKNAYEKIINTPKDEINKIINISIKALQSIECQDSCKFSNHYQHMDKEVKEILANNHDAIGMFMVEPISIFLVE